jgi:hypothetical protein
MKGNLLEKYAAAKPADAEKPEELETVPDDLGAFGFLRGVRDRAIMLELRHKDGSIDAFGYAWLSKSTFDPSEGITLHFGASTIKITGRKLNAEVRPNVRLFAAILRHRVPWICEADGAAIIQASKDTVLIERIEVK